LKIIDQHTIEVFGKKYPMEKRGSRRFIIGEFSPTEKPVQVFDDNLISKKLKKAKVEST